MEHGITVRYASTPLTPPRSVDATMPVAVGVAPVWKTAAHRTDAVNVPILAVDFADVEAALGYSAPVGAGTLKSWTEYTLCEVMHAYFTRYGLTPAVFINCFDPYGNPDHRTVDSVNQQTLDGGSVTIQVDDAFVESILIDNLVVQDEAAEVTYDLDVDYTADYDDDFRVVIARIEGGAILADDAILTVTYSQALPSGVTADDVVAALDQVENVYYRHGKLPGQIVAPLWSIDTGVAAKMIAVAASIDGSYSCQAWVDIDTDAAIGADVYTEVYGIKVANGWSEPDMGVCWPLFTKANYVYHASTDAACDMSETAHDHDGVPSHSPSNKRLLIDGCVDKAGNSIYLTRLKANVLNDQGIVTAIRAEDEWRLWGNRTAATPSSVDPAEYFIPNRAMMRYVGNTIVRTFFNKVDEPISRRFVSSFQDSVNDWLNGLIARGHLLSGKCEFLQGDNPITSLIDGVVEFRVNLGLQGAAESIVVNIAMDPSAMTALWS